MCGNVNMRVRDSGGTVSSAGMGVHRCGYGDTRCEGGYSLLFGSQEFAGKRP